MTEHDPLVLPDDFLEQIKQALEHLYDFPYLQRLPLARQIVAQAHRTSSTHVAGQVLRRELMHAIESLRHGSEVLFRAPEGRVYNLLKLYYIHRMTIKEVSVELGISERQAYRDLKRGQATIADMVWSRHFAADSAPDGLDVSSVEAELSRLSGFVQTIDLTGFIASCWGAVDSLAAQRHIEPVLMMPESSLQASINVPIARQVITKLLSHSIKSARPGRLTIQLQPRSSPLTLVITYRADPAQSPLDNGITIQLLRRLNWRVSSSTEAMLTQIRLEMVTEKVSLLVIDDNEGIVELLARYLAGHNCRLLSATSSVQGLDLARRTRPDVILLDVMMPEMDGWELLQRLKSYPESASIPVVICSVLNDPELAASLGASSVIVKPVTQDKILETLRALEIL